MKKILFMLAIAMMALNCAAQGKKAAKKSVPASGETITVTAGATSSTVTDLALAYINKHSELEGAPELAAYAQDPSKDSYAVVTDTCVFLNAGEMNLSVAIWPRDNGKTLVGVIYCGKQISFYNYDKAAGTMTRDNGVGSPVTSIRGGDDYLSFDVDGIHCTVMRLTGYGSYFNFNGSKFVPVKYDLGQAPTW